MEVRCGSCNKLFRVSDDKITGKGIKFACTSCGASVQITKEDFEHYTLSKATVSTLDLFKPAPKPKPPQAAPVPESVNERARAGAPEEFAGFDLSAPDEQQPDAQEEHPPLFAESAATAEPEAPVSPAPAPQPAPEPPEKPAAVPVPEEKIPSAQPVAAPPVQKAAPVKTTAAPPRPAPAPKVPPAPIEKEPLPTDSRLVELPVNEPFPRSSRAGLFLILTVLVIVIGAGGYVLFAYLHETGTAQKNRSAAPEMTSIAGLRLTSEAGVMETDGDLLVTGVVENATDRERAAWYVVADIYDAKGAVMGTVKLLNGKQLYTRRDYDILAKRGENIQELKAKSLQNQGVVIPPRGSVKFEMRYLQPPSGIASFNAALQPFDPVRLYKEIAGDAQQP
jgi:zinc-ribbon domain